MGRHEDIPSVMCSTRRYVRPTPCRYSVIMGCPDPPTPALYFNTNDRAHARRVFDRLKTNEINRGGGGEFSIVIYDHGEAASMRPKPVRYFRLTDAQSDNGVGFVHSIIYEESLTLDEFGEVDLRNMEAEQINVPA